MVKHSEQFLEKQKLKKEFEEKLSKIRLEVQQKKFDEMLEIERLRIEKKQQKKIDAENKKREKVKKIYEEMKADDKRYKAYLESQKKYREKYKLIKKERIKKDILDEIGNEEYKVYSVNNKNLYITVEGRFINDKGKEVFGSKHPSGYIYLGFGHKKFLAHRLVWEAFKGEIPEGMEIDHKNSEKYDNRLCNLRLCSHKDNCNNPISIENYKRHNKEVDRSYLRKENRK